MPTKDNTPFGLYLTLVGSYEGEIMRPIKLMIYLVIKENFVHLLTGDRGFSREANDNPHRQGFKRLGLYLFELYRW